ncbi:MAG: glycosyltransferase [Phycisphaerae bacterium]|nr:glycosyltransferase [Phycisphaerae bacterium]
MKNQPSPPLPINRRILVVGYGRANRATAYTHRIKGICSSLANARYDVTLLWLTPFYSCSSSQFRVLRSQLRVIVWPTLPVFSVRPLTVVSRFVFSLTIALLLVVLRPACVHAETAGVAALVPPRRVRCPLVMDLHGDELAELSMAGMKEWRIRQAEADLQAAAQRADAIVCVSENLKNTLLRHNTLARIPMCIAPCGVNVEQFAAERCRRVQARQRLNVADRLVVCYSGGLATWQCVGETLELVRQLRDKDGRVFFLLLTHHDPARWDTALRRVGTPVRDYQVLSLTPEDVPKWLSAGDLGLLLRRPSPVNAVASPTKLGEYLAAGMPVVTTQHAGDAPEIIRHSACGYVLEDVAVGTGELDVIHTLLCSVVADRERVASRCVHAARNYQSWAVSTQRITELYANLLST